MPPKEDNKLEQKMFKCEIKSFEEEEDNDLYVGSFSALGATFGNVDLYNDKIENGAFIKVIKEFKKTKTMPKSLIHHSYWDIGAIYTDIKETDDGLVVEGKFIDTTRGRDLRKEVKTGAIDAMSIGFNVGLVEFDNKKNIRIIKEISELPEISFVTFPANPKAVILDAKSKPNSIKDLEKLLKDNGYSQKESKIIVSQGCKSIYQRDADEHHRDDDDNHRDDETKEKILESLDKIIKLGKKE